MTTEGTSIIGHALKRISCVKTQDGYLDVRVRIGEVDYDLDHTGLQKAEGPARGEAEVWDLAKSSQSHGTGVTDIWTDGETLFIFCGPWCVEYGFGIEGATGTREYLRFVDDANEVAELRGMLRADSDGVRIV